MGGTTLDKLKQWPNFLKLVINGANLGQFVLQMGTNEILKISKENCEILEHFGSKWGGGLSPISPSPCYAPV